MLCSNCSSKEAAFHYKYIKNGVKNEIHLCTDCAKELGYITGTDIIDKKELHCEEILGYVGTTGNSSAPHLHIEVYKNNKRVDPTTVFKNLTR